MNVVENAQKLHVFLAALQRTISSLHTKQMQIFLLMYLLNLSSIAYYNSKLQKSLNKSRKTCPNALLIVNTFDPLNSAPLEYIEFHEGSALTHVTRILVCVCVKALLKLRRRLTTTQSVQSWTS
jgi:hypothetical protein